MDPTDIYCTPALPKVIFYVPGTINKQAKPIIMVDTFERGEREKTLCPIKN